MVDNKGRASSALAPLALSLKGVVAIFVVYALAHALLRLAASPNLPQDDVMAVLYSQTLELGYSPRQPPLYDWMAWLVQRLTGPNLISFLLLKYALLTATAAFIYSAALRIFDERLWAALSAFSLLLLYQIGWNIHEGVTHTSAMICALAATFWAFTRVMEVGQWRDYLMLGLAMGAGGISKYGFVIFVVILFAAAALQPAMRTKLLGCRMLAAAALAAAITAPFALWVIYNDHDLVALYSDTLSPGDQNHWRAASRGVFLAFRSTLIFLAPLILIVPVIFTGAFGAACRAATEAFRPSVGPDWEKLLFHMALGGLLVLIAGALVTGAVNYRMRYMHPFYLLTPIWLIAMARAGMTRDWQPKAFAAASLVFALAVVALRIGYLWVGEPPFCSKCRQMIPYDALADALRDRGFKSGTIIAGYRHTAGNLRQRFPDARVVALRRPRVVPPIRPGDKHAQIAIVWDVASEGAQTPKGAIQQVAVLGGRLAHEPATIDVQWTHAWRPDGYRNSTWKLIVIDLNPQ